MDDNFNKMLEFEKVFMEEQERLHEHPLKSVLGHVTKVTRTKDGQTFDIKLNERGREFVNNIYKKQRFDRNEIVGTHINTEKERLIMATEVLYHGRKPTEWRYFHCINCGTVWRDDYNNDGALHVIMQCPVCGISCSDISHAEAVAILKQQAATEALELWNTDKS